MLKAATFSWLSVAHSQKTEVKLFGPHKSCKMASWLAVVRPLCVCLCACVWVVCLAFVISWSWFCFVTSSVEYQSRTEETLTTATIMAEGSQSPPTLSVCLSICLFVCLCVCPFVCIFNQFRCQFIHNTYYRCISSSSLSSSCFFLLTCLMLQQCITRHLIFFHLS